MDFRAARRVARSAFALLLVCGSAAGCGDAGLICASSTNPGGSLVGCTGDPDDDGLSVVVAGQDAPSPR
jgi:hypothetical protein